MSKVEPIKPTDIKQEIPDWVIKGANECIKKHYIESRKESKFTQDELIYYVLNCAPGDDETITRRTLFDNHWLDIEPIYRQAGWKVEYDKPGYNESYEANFTFSVSK